MHTSLPNPILNAQRLAIRGNRARTVAPPLTTAGYETNLTYGCTGASARPDGERVQCVSVCAVAVYGTGIQLDFVRHRC